MNRCFLAAGRQLVRMGGTAGEISHKKAQFSSRRLMGAVSEEQ